jgi:tubulin polyglutamylase TTLL6/13
MPHDRCVNLQRHQVVNHFPGITELCRKDLLARNLGRLQRVFPEEYSFFPRTFVLPADAGSLDQFCRSHPGGKPILILKPENLSQGRGISLVRGNKDIPPVEHMVCQQYLARPMLVDGFKGCH